MKEILVVEDRILTQDIIRRCLSRGIPGLEVQFASTQRQATEAVNRYHDTGLIIMDWLVPLHEAYGCTRSEACITDDLVASMRHFGFTAPIIAHCPSKHWGAMQAAGCTHFVSKAKTRMDLVPLVTELIVGSMVTA